MVNRYSNVLFLPGFMGSRLYEKDGTDFDKRWLPLFDNDVDSLSMLSASTSQYDLYVKEKDILTTGYCGTLFDLCLVYKGFADTMDALAASTTVNMEEWTPIAYDWRLDYNTLLESGKKEGEMISYLKETDSPYIIEELKRLASTSSTGKVTIVAHSNGGLLAKALMQKLGTTTVAQYIDKVILVATPQVGSPKAIAGLLHGTDQGLPTNYLSVTFSPGDARSLGRNTPAAYDLLPSNGYFTYTDNPVITFDDNLTDLDLNWKEQYSDAEYPDDGIHSVELLRNFMIDQSRMGATTTAFTNIPIYASSTLFDLAQNNHADLDNFAWPSNIPLYDIAGWGVKTISGIHYMADPNLDCSLTNLGGCILSALIPRNVRRVSNALHMVIDGDGTVVNSSALWGNGATSSVQRFWVNLDRFNYDNSQSYKHMDLFSVPQVDELITTILKTPATSTVTLPAQYIVTSTSTLTSTEDRLDYLLHSPLTLGFKDSLGNYTGAATTSPTTTISNVPGVQYDRIGELQFLSVPKSLSGQVVMRGYASGSFRLDVSATQGNTTLSTTSFAAIPSATSTRVTLNVSSTTPTTASSTLLIDFDGNGTTDASLPAAQGTSTTISLHPEAQLQIKSADFSVKVVASSTASTSVGTYATYAMLADVLGNKTGITFDKTTNASSSLLSLSLTGISYNSAATSSVQASSTITYTYATTTASTTLYQQQLTIGTTTSATSTYNPTTNTSYIESDDQGVHYQHTWTGLKILRLVTENGVVRWMFGS